MHEGLGLLLEPPPGRSRQSRKAYPRCDSFVGEATAQPSIPSEVPKQSTEKRTLDAKPGLVSQPLQPSVASGVPKQEANLSLPPLSGFSVRPKAFSTDLNLPP